MPKIIQLQDKNKNKIYPKIKNDFMMINLNQEQKNTTTNIFKVNFNNVVLSYGDGLEFYNNGIRIGKGIKKIRADLILWLEQTPSSYASFHIYKNGNEITYNLNQNTGAVWSTANSFAFIDVVEGDVIYAYVRFADANSTFNRISGFYNGSCNLAVQVIE